VICPAVPATNICGLPVPVRTPWNAEPRSGTLLMPWSAEIDSVNSVLEATTLCVLPPMLQVPVTTPLKTPDVKEPVNVPEVIPLDWEVTLQ